MYFDRMIIKMRGRIIMTLSLKGYQTIVSGLTQKSSSFRDALNELSGIVEDNQSFYSYRKSAYNRLNHALVGHDISNEKPVNVVGVVDFENQKIQMSHFGEALEYDFDDIDDRYLDRINQSIPNRKTKINQLPITEIAANMLNDLNKDAHNKPQIEESQLTNSRMILEKAFANEMVFQVELEDYIKDNNLDKIYENHNKKFDEMIDKKNFEASFNDGLKDLDNQVSKLNMKLEK